VLQCVTLAEMKHKNRLEGIHRSLGLKKQESRRTEISCAVPKSLDQIQYMIYNIRLVTNNRI
jgi:hypothetical protein